MRHDARTPAWIITHEHANAVLSAAVCSQLCTCRADAGAGSHHQPTCPYRLMVESAEILSILAATDIAHYKGHASLAEMVSTHVSAFRGLIGQAARVAGNADGADTAVEVVAEDGHTDLETQAADAASFDASYVEHELASLADIENACRKDMHLRFGIRAVPALAR
ncbi:hypothetical protein LMG24235_04452 [Paraburkholderia sabiae]|nr:hypothetical protein LMG24235_04452 [Paraburkholderia sabiae]CAG9232370.1 hypothetical protein PSAB6_580003 [Paraburkholderia sabiae]